jgi:hypothetical protein
LELGNDAPPSLCFFASNRAEVTGGKRKEDREHETEKEMQTRIANVRYRLNLMYEGSEASITKNIFFYNRVLWHGLKKLTYPLSGLYDIYSQFRHGDSGSGVGQAVYYLFHTARLSLAVWAPVAFLTMQNEIKGNVMTTTDPFQAWIPLFSYLFFTLYFSILKVVLSLKYYLEYY